MAEVFLDTNVLAYRFDHSEPLKKARATQILREVRNVAISTQVMLELHSVLTSKLEPPLSAKQARQVLDGLAALTVTPADATLVLRAADTCTRHHLSIWDTMIVEAAVESGCVELWTEDLQDGAVIRGVRVVNPFAGQ